MKAGQLRNRIVLKSPSVALNELGETVTTWTTVATIWAAIEPLRGREYVEARQEQAEVSTRIVMRAHVTPMTGWRITWNEHNYEIVSVIHDERVRQYELMCVEAL